MKRDYALNKLNPWLSQCHYRRISLVFSSEMGSFITSLFSLPSCSESSTRSNATCSRWVRVNLKRRGTKLCWCKCAGYSVRFVFDSFFLSNVLDAGLTSRHLAGLRFPFFSCFFFCLSSSTFDRLADSLPSTATGNRWGTETFHPILVAPTVLFVCSVSFFGELDRQSIADPMP